MVRVMFIDTILFEAKWVANPAESASRRRDLIRVKVPVFKGLLAGFVAPYPEYDDEVAIRSWNPTNVAILVFTVECP